MAYTNPFSDPDFGKELVPKATANPFSDPDFGKPRDNALTRGFKKGANSLNISKNLYFGDTAETAEAVREAGEYAHRNPGSKESAEFMQAWERGEGITGGLREWGDKFAKDWREAKGFVPGAASVARNLKGAGEFVVEQTPNMLAPTAGMLAGGFAGSAASPVVGTAVGGFAGAAAGNTAIEGGYAVLEALQKAGIDTNDTTAVKSYLDQHRDELMKNTAIKGGVLGLVDIASLSLGGKLLRGPARAATDRALTRLGVDLADKTAVAAAKKSEQFASLIANDAIYQASRKGAGNLARNAGAAALEPAGEFAGEYFGQGLGFGEWDTKNAALEALASIGQSGLTYAGQKGFQMATRPRQGKPAPENPPEAPSFTPPLDQTETPPPSAPLGLPPSPAPAGLLPPPVFEASPDGTITTPADRNARTERIRRGEVTDRTPVPQSKRLGLDPEAGPLSDAAALSVDSGASTAVQSLARAAENERNAPAKRQEASGKAGPLATATTEGKAGSKNPPSSGRPSGAPSLPVSPAAQVWNGMEIDERRQVAKEAGLPGGLAAMASHGLFEDFSQELQRALAERLAGRDAPLEGQTGERNGLEAPEAKQANAQPAQGRRPAQAGTLAGSVSTGAVPGAGNAAQELNGAVSPTQGTSVAAAQAVLDDPKAPIPAKVKARRVLDRAAADRKRLALASVRKYPAARDFSSIARTLLSNARSDGGNELIIAERTATAEDDATGQSRPQSQGVQGTADGRVAVNKIPTNRVVDNETPSESTQNAVRAYPKEQAEKLAKSTEETISGTPVSEYSDAALRKLSKQKDYAVEKEREELELKLRKLPKAGPGAVEVRRELEQKIKKLSKQKSLIAEKARRELKRRAPKPALALRIGTDWNKTQPVTVRDGVIYLGDDPAYDYETGDEVRIDETATPQQIADTLRAARAINNNEKFYGLAKAPKEDGPVFTEYEGNPEGAIERLMKEKAGEARAVVTREGLGEIDLVYGDEKHGLAKIADKHKGMLPKLAGLLRSGRVVKLEGNAKRYIVAVGSPPQIAIVALDYNGQTKTWVVTSYEDAKGNTYRNLMENGVTVTTMDTDGTTVADDTARRNNAVDQSLAPSTEKSSAPQSRPPKGRAQPLTAQVLTPSGYRLMGDIRVGDAVIAADGSLSEVTGVFPQGRKPIYRITLSDGSTTRSTLDHLWKVRGEDEEGYKVLPLSEIMDAMARGSRFEIPPLGTGGSFNFASDNPDLLLDLEGMAFKRGMGVR